MVLLDVSCIDSVLYHHTPPIEKAGHACVPDYILVATNVYPDSPTTTRSCDWPHGTHRANRLVMRSRNLSHRQSKLIPAPLDPHRIALCLPTNARLAVPVIHMHTAVLDSCPIPGLPERLGDLRQHPPITRDPGLLPIDGDKASRASDLAATRIGMAVGMASRIPACPARLGGPDARAEHHQGRNQTHSNELLLLACHV